MKRRRPTRKTPPAPPSAPDEQLRRENLILRGIVAKMGARVHQEQEHCRVAVARMAVLEVELAHLREERRTLRKLAAIAGSRKKR